MTAVPMIGFLGFGKMAQAISTGLNATGFVPGAKQAATAANYDNLVKNTERLGVAPIKNNEKLLKKAHVIVLGVKPYQVRSVLEPLHGHFTSDHLLISLAAGISIDELADMLPLGVQVIRAMPNTPSLVGRGLAALCYQFNCSPANKELAKKIFKAVGDYVEIDESLFPAVSALSGAGPAYVFMFAEALTEAGVLLGLKRDQATELALKTLAGSAALALGSDKNLYDLKGMVTSPGGITIEGCYHLEKAGFRAAVIGAVEAAAAKNEKLNK